MRIHERTFLTALFLVAALVLVLPADSAAQGDETGTGTAADGPTVALNLGRIKHQLALSQAREESGSPLRLEYRLSVFGVAPPDRAPTGIRHPERGGAVRSTDARRLPESLDPKGVPNTGVSPPPPPRLVIRAVAPTTGTGRRPSSFTSVGL